MPVATASDRLAIEHQKDVAGVAGGVASAVISTAMGADPAAISTWFFAALDGLMARIQAGYALNRRSTMGYLPQHGALNRVTVSAIPGSLDIGSTRSRLGITGPVAFKNAISAGLGEEQALRSMATQMSGVADELVRNGDRDVIMNTIRRGKGLVAYRRRLAGKSCGFCSMIASRGAVYTAETSTFRTHPHCRCWAEPLYRHEREPIEVQRLQRQWRRVTAGKSGTAAQREWRKHWEQRATPAARAREGIRELIPAPVAAAAPVDPALKLTVAQIKQIAKDAGVPLSGATRKADFVAILRNYEDVWQVKVKGLPEWKAPRPTVTPRLNEIDAPPLGVPAEKPVLSGASLNDWADHFTYDRQYGRHVYVDANGNTPPEGIRVHNLRANIQGSFDTGLNEYMVKDGTAFSFDGVAYLIEHPPDQFGSPWVSKTLADLRRAHEDIPAAKLANKSYSALSGDNPGDAFWRKEFNNPDHVSAAMAARGNLTLWQFRGPAIPGGTFSRVNYDVLRHETGHNIDDMVGRQAHGSKSAAWDAAAKSDVGAASKITDLVEDTRGHGELAKFDRGRAFPEGVTSYGRSSVGEDYAESVRLYQEGVIGQGRLAAGAEKGPIYFRDLFPARAKILDDVFPDFAKAQKAEIAALRAPKPVAKAAVKPVAAGDLSKLKVPELRALAKERGVTGYSKLTKPQLLEQLGGISELPSPQFVPLTAEQFDAALRTAATGNDALRVASVELRSAAERTAYADYVSRFRFVNTALRENAGQIPAGRTFSLERRIAAGLDSGMARAGLPEDIWVHRVAGTVEFQGTPTVGAEWTDHGFISTSTQRKLGYPGEVQMRILVPRGTRAVAAPELDVNEILLDRGTRFRVVSVEPPDARGVWHLDVQVVPKSTVPADLSKLGAKAEAKVAKESAGDALVTAARKRQADIDYARARAELLSETEEWLGNQGTLASMAVQLRRDAKRYGIEGHKDMAALFRAIDSGDEAKVRKAIEAVAKKQNLTRVERAGEVVKYDRALHGDIGKDLKPGDLAVVVRPGYTFERNGETIRLHKAKVESATREEIEAAKIAEITSQIARRRHMILGSMSRTERLELRNGERFIHKKITDPDVEFVKRQGDAEELGALVARATGLEAPTVYRAGAGELYMTFMDGELAVDAGILRSTRLAASPEGSVMKVLDYLIGNGDREGNGGNWLIGARGNIQVIDHAAAWGFGGNVPYDASLAAQLSRNDIDVLRSRIKLLRSEFERLGRGNWWRDTMSRIEELAKDAKGTRALLGGRAEIKATKIDLTHQPPSTQPPGILRGQDALDAPAVKLETLTASGDPRAEALWYRTGDNSIETGGAPGAFQMSEQMRSGHFTSEMRSRIADIDSLMAESHLSDPIEVYRGVERLGGLRPDEAIGSGKNLVGREFTDKAFVSTTTDAEHASWFGGTVMRIHVPPGTRAIRMADRAGTERDAKESEILLNRGLKYRIIAQYGRGELKGPWGGAYVLDVEVVL